MRNSKKQRIGEVPEPPFEALEGRFVLSALPGLVPSMSSERGCASPGDFRASRVGVRDRSAPVVEAGI